MGHGKKKAYIKTFGCQMNVYDSERMGDLLREVGYDLVEAMVEADLILLNTCHIREKAAEKIYSELGRIRPLKDARRAQGKDLSIVVAGCVAQAEGREMIRRAPLIDLVLGPQEIHRLLEFIAQFSKEKRSIVRTNFPIKDKFNHFSADRQVPDRRARRSPSAFLTVQEGCDKFCTFCVVPYTRGVEFSRPLADIIAEAENLVLIGVKEITLLGQNVNAYHGKSRAGAEISLAELIAALSEIEGLERIRYTTSHPKDMREDLIAAHRNIEKLMPYLHLPFQSGSDRILAAMNRKHTISDYLTIIEALRKARPNIALSTDIIVGFPGETEEEFEETLALVEEVRFAQAFSFKYSPRPGTPAASLSPLPEGVSSERLQRLQRVLNQQQSHFNQSCVGQTVPVLFEKAGRKPGQLIGRSPYLQAVHAKAPEVLRGEIINVEICQSHPNSLAGVIKSVDRAPN